MTAASRAAEPRPIRHYVINAWRRDHPEAPEPTEYMEIGWPPSSIINLEDDDGPDAEPHLLAMEDGRLVYRQHPFDYRAGLSVNEDTGDALLVIAIKPAPPGQ